MLSAQTMVKATPKALAGLRMSTALSPTASSIRGWLMLTWWALKKQRSLLKGTWLIKKTLNLNQRQQDCLVECGLKT